ncbi:MAG: 3-phosphoshikimate 1-carboxyvinyltransferase [Bacteroidetes bacterium GWF2_42_66]|nr:MAG: 3-phosphoshikimate 1-carboxyvinyltransferase [Bacteroidetes bacterium GWA2_42_15]OFX96760.1 MAG: 3-phosphoshikimate 1-carboxyvinyltransferase [Bacteroidetes bacterium GWE2_42_39]OFY45452.1 MAG: 3-phosphoshikimate 1-carboxyvinyltransferase [Bacteroidetes bacterium GWF2_42_66]HBL76163.1 3-phosphoshikimate 1-carboxyvinyltransferase [Prolixibacteraceae bacterium]HCR90521.1 3-phosphoshikimate 1-carboxyvinyltransferase [Prolixibacteraceae bacterium]
MKYSVSKPDKTLKGSIQLPASKSIANRALIINALSYSPYPIKNLSDSDDTRVMEQAFTSNTNHFDIGHAGTAMRFLTAFLSMIVGEWTLTGSERMKQRPIGILVDALNSLGARIEYLENEGFPPLKIYGSHLKGDIIELDGSVSSQYISALLMIAPSIDGGLTLRLKNKIISRSYIELTLKLMEQFGVKHAWKGNEIRIAEQTYRPVQYIVEADWSSASYWYQMTALAEEVDLELEDLKLDSLQGDCVIAKWFEPFGVVSEETEKGVRLSKTEKPLPKNLQLNFIENPDVAQTFAVLCVMKNVPFHFTGLETLKIKETNRIEALQNELAKFGAEITEPAHGELQWDGTFPLEKVDNPSISTYKDHRMAMAFAPACQTYGPVTVEEPMVVTKSYPAFWNDLKKVGFIVNE